MACKHEMRHHAIRHLILLIKRDGIDEVSDTANPFFLLHVSPTKATAADKFGARMKHTSVVDDNGLRHRISIEILV
jgi:hypothetical protein